MPTNKNFTVKIESILSGQAPTKFYGGANQFLSSIAIDPDHAADGGDSDVRAGGIITPATYADFASASVDSDPIAMMTSAKEQNKIYVVLLNGGVFSYAISGTFPGTFGSETELYDANAAEGGFYYNNYLYVPTQTDVSRYGPLDGTPSNTTDFWTSTLGLTAPTDTDYPALNNYIIPNHFGHVHVDGSAYFFDYKDGQGLIHKIKTTKVTNEGDTDDGSAYNVLDLPFGYYPTDIDSWGNYLVISSVQMTDSSINLGRSALFLWDTFSPSANKKVDIASPMTSALENRNGELIVFHGSPQDGHFVSRYLGGDSLEQLAFLPEGHPPLAGATDVIGNRISWGTQISTPEQTAVVMSLGYQSAKLPADALHCIARVASGGTDVTIGTLKYFQSTQQGSVPRLVMGYNDTTSGSAFGIDSYSTSATQDSIIQLQVFNIGEKFQINKIKIPLSEAVAANQTITPKVVVDNGTTTYSGTDYGLATINNTNYTNNEQLITLYPLGIIGQVNFSIQLEFTGTDVNSVAMPITIEGEVLQD